MARQNTPSFSEELAGTEPSRWDRDLALLSSATYRDDAEQGALPPGWAQVSHDECRSARLVTDASQKRDRTDVQLNDPSKFRACVYKHESGDRYAVVFRGTKTMSWKKADSPNSFAESWKKDLAVNIGQGVGLDTEQYKLALNVAQRAKARWGNNVVFAGHSLGGGLAAAASIYTRNSAVTFNAAGVHDNTLDRASTFKDDAQHHAQSGAIRSIVVNGDGLNELQSSTMTVFRLTKALTGGPPMSAGVPVYLDHPHMQPGTGKGVKLHGLEATVSAMDTRMHHQFTDTRTSEALMVALARSQSPNEPELRRQVHAVREYTSQHRDTHGVDESVQRGVAAMTHGDHAIRHPREKLADFRNRPAYAWTSADGSQPNETDPAVREYARTQVPADAWQRQSPDALHGRRESLPSVSAPPSQRAHVPSGRSELDEMEAKFASTFGVSPHGGHVDNVQPQPSRPRASLGLGMSIPTPTSHMVSQLTTLEPTSAGTSFFPRGEHPSPNASPEASAATSRSSSPQPRASTPQLDELADAERRFGLLQRRPSGTAATSNVSSRPASPSSPQPRASSPDQLDELAAAERRAGLLRRHPSGKGKDKVPRQ
jgi:hypothetical protein